MAIRKIPNETSTFHYYNANPKNRRTGDCVVRALSLFLDKSWDEVFKELTEICLKYKIMPDEKAGYEKYLSQLGIIKHNQPRKADNTKYTGSEFCEQLADPDKKYFAHIGGHHVVCIKGCQVNDIWNSTSGCIGNFWEV